MELDILVHTFATGHSALFLGTRAVPACLQIAKVIKMPDGKFRARNNTPSFVGWEFDTQEALIKFTQASIECRPSDGIGVHYIGQLDWWN